MGGAIARSARTAGTAGLSRAKQNIRQKALIAAPIGAVVGGVIEAKVPQLPQLQNVPPQLLIGAAGVGVGLLLKGKMAENVLLGALGPLCAGVSTLTRRYASGGVLAGDEVGGEFSGGPFGYGNTPIVAGEFDDV